MTDAPIPQHLGSSPGASPPLRVWECSGLLCTVAMNLTLGLFVGYVRVPGIGGEQADQLDVHGGVTYGPDDQHWIGWDAGHCDDYIPGLLDHLPSATVLPGRRWTQTEAEIETERLAASAAAVCPQPDAAPSRSTRRQARHEDV